MSVERCPACRNRLAQEPVCPRCGCNLALVRRAEIQSRQLFSRALHAWAAGEEHLALTLVQASLVLKHDPLAAAVGQALRPMAALQRQMLTAD